MSIGVKGGVPLTQTFHAQITDPAGVSGNCAECARERTVPYVLGLSLEVRLKGPFSLSAEALFSRTDYNHTSTLPSPSSRPQVIDEKHLVDRWEIPLFLKYRMNKWHGLYPFVAAGVSVQHNQDFTESGFVLIPPAPGFSGFRFPETNEPDLATSVGLGGVVAVGATFGTGRVRPSLEYRYTRWVDQPIVVRPLIAPFVGALRPPYFETPTLHSVRNESQILAGLTFDLGGNGGTSSSSQRRAGRFILVGVKGGVPLTPAFVAHSMDTFPGFSTRGTCGECASQRTLPYTVGPSVEIRLPRAYSLTAEALYSRADYNHTGLSVGASKEDVKHAEGRWEFPVLLKYTLNVKHALHPFIAAGISVQHGRDRELSHLTISAIGSSVSIAPSPLRPEADYTLVGPTFAGGLSFGARTMRPSVEFRYTRWTDQAIVINSPLPLNPPPTLHSNQNQAQFLVGLMF